MNARRLTDAGIERMGAFLDSLTTDDPDGWPPFGLADPELTHLVEPEVEVENRIFVTRWDAGAYLYSVLDNAGLDDVATDAGLWSWLALFFFDSLCPRGPRGRRKPGARARWIPEVANHKRYYRHLLAGPYMIYRAHADEPKRALALLCGPIDRPGDIVEQLAARQELVTNPGLIGAATLLYVDRDTRKPKRGAGGKGPGSPRRLADIYQQFDLTWDLYSLEPEELIGMLPPEFDRFRPTSI